MTTQAHVPASTVVHLQSTTPSGTATALAAVGSPTGSLPATLCRMSNIATAAGTGTLSEAEIASLHSEYSQLSGSVLTAVNTAIQAEGRAEAEAQAKAQAVQQAATTSQQKDASAQGDSSDTRRRSAQAVIQRPDVPVAASATASAAQRPQDDSHPVAVVNRLQTAQAAGLAQFQRQTAAPRPVLSVVA